MTNESTDFAKINARDLARVLPFRASDDVRYYLNGVYVEPLDQGAIIVATTGHMLAAMRSQDTHVSEAVIMNTSAAFASAVKRVGKSELSFVRAVTKTARLEVVNQVPGNGRNQGESVVFVQPTDSFIDGKYPDWKKIIPSDEKMGTGLPSIYNAEYLRQAINAICDGPNLGRYGSFIHFYHASASDPESSAAIIRGKDDFICVVMPARDTRLAAMPSWLRSTSPQAA